jgi:hypothetical protein
MLDWIRRDWDWMLARENQGRIHRVAHGPLKYHGDFVSCKLSGHLKATEAMSCAVKSNFLICGATSQAPPFWATQYI